MSELEPLFNYVLVRPDKQQERSAGGIITADVSKEKPCTGTVLSVGPGMFAEDTGELIPMIVKENDRVLFPRFIGIPIEWGNENLYMMKSTDIMAIIRE